MQISTTITAVDRDGDDGVLITFLTALQPGMLWRSCWSCGLKGNLGRKQKVPLEDLLDAKMVKSMLYSGSSTFGGKAMPTRFVSASIPNHDVVQVGGYLDVSLLRRRSL